MLRDTAGTTYGAADLRPVLPVFRYPLALYKRLCGLGTRKKPGSTWRTNNMSPRIRVLVIQNDCARLISMMLWLEQFAEFEIAGIVDDSQRLQEQLVENEPDVLLIDAESLSPERVKCLKALHAFPNAPALIIIGESAQADLLMAQESDLHLTQATSVNELCESLRKANNRRRQVFVTANMPLTKAG